MMQSSLTTCVKCKQKYVLPAIAAKDRPFVCDACWEAIMQQAADRIKIMVRK